MIKSILYIFALLKTSYFLFSKSPTHSREISVVNKIVITGNLFFINDWKRVFKKVLWEDLPYLSIYLLHMIHQFHLLKICMNDNYEIAIQTLKYH